MQKNLEKENGNNYSISINCYIRMVKMKIFNTKKLQEEWQKKVEESYNQGKRDAENGFNNLLNAVTKDKEYWNSLSEKELLIEMMLALKFNNNNVEVLNNKISYIQNYKDIFKELNNNMDSLKKAEDSLSLNIENEKQQIIEFENLIKSVMSKINDLDSTLKEIIDIKDNINKVIKDIGTTIPKLNEISSQIDKIAKEINNTIETYSDSPAEILSKLREQINELYNEFKDDDNYDEETIKDKLNDIYSKTDSALSEYGTYSLYSKIDDLKNELNDLNSKLSNSLDPYAYDSLYSKIQDLESKLDSINFSN